MSKKSAKGFLQRVRTDSEFRRKVMATKDDADRMALIRAEGFNCTDAEINAVEIAMGGMEKICGAQSSFGKTSFLSGAIKSLFKR